LLALALCPTTSGLSADLVLPKDTQAQVYFSPRGGAQDALVAEIGKAKESIYVQAYSFTSEPIVQALIQAQQRGVKVEIILDKSQSTDKRSGTSAVRKAGIHTVIDRKHAIAHNKIMIIDQETLVTGSFNFTKSAEEKNAENLLVIRSSELTRLYLDNWRHHLEHADGH
jgi:phosphatidylserine/phosphatidylglycerophosphate/cardiolipin synthase-like enzyme